LAVEARAILGHIGVRDVLGERLRFLGLKDYIGVFSSELVIDTCANCRWPGERVSMRKLRTFEIGTPRKRGEGIRVGTVRYLPRGVRKEEYAQRDLFDVWFPLLAPSKELIRRLKSSEITTARWSEFARSYERELMRNADARQALVLLAELAKRTPIAIGCYCTDESRCHRSVLRALINEAGGGK
jgi:uncharacterized protein YeaO (DUF488 family)